VASGRFDVQLRRLAVAADLDLNGLIHVDLGEPESKLPFDLTYAERWLIAV
jgi:hypothetical protein